MVNRLEPLNLVDFTGGLNLRTNQFQLAENETPDLLNVDIDPRGGFYTRKGWQRWNVSEVIDTTITDWAPRSTFLHVWTNGAQQVYVANNGWLYSAGSDAVFTRVGTLVGEGNPHDFDLAAWGDDVYIACGMFHLSYKRTNAGTPVVLDNDGWSEVTAPVNAVMPQCEYVAAHAGYLFCAATVEAGANHFSRVRWSHPGKPDSWRADDYLDIDTAGGRITGLVPFRDHLLIFKTTSVWALYGYDDASWQLIPVSSTVGCPAVTAIGRSETTVFFFSASDKGGIYRYQGAAPEYISENLRPAFESTLAYDNVFVSWAGRRLWVGMPWTRLVGSTADPTSCFVYDPDVGNGAWTMYFSEYGAVASVLDGSDVSAKYPLAAFWSDNTATLVTLDYINDAYDLIFEPSTLGYKPTGDPTDPIGPLSTSAGEDIVVGGDAGVGQSFDSYYRTRWLHAGWPDRKKSWRRPTFICRQVDRDTDLLVETYRDYNETTVQRTRTLRVRAEGTSYWTDTGYAEAPVGGFDWTEYGITDPAGTGADWGSERRGSNLIRAGSMGLARSVQMRVRASPATARQRWGVDGIVAKFVQRRFR